MEQKRLHVRLEDLVEVEFSSTLSGVTTIIRTKTRDISGGGVKVYLNHRLNHGEKMQLKIKIPDVKKIIQTDGQVISSELIGVIGDEGKETLYETRFKFNQIKQEYKKEIIAYIYECKRKKMSVFGKSN